MACFFQHALQRMEHFAHLANTFRPALRADRHDHEFLEVDFVVSVFATVDDVGHRHRQLTSIGAADVAIKRQIVGLGRSLSDGERYSQNSVSAEFRFIFGAIHLDHQAVDHALLKGF